VPPDGEPAETASAVTPSQKEPAPTPPPPAKTGFGLDEVAAPAAGLRVVAGSSYLQGQARGNRRRAGLVVAVALLLLGSAVLGAFYSLYLWAFKPDANSLAWGVAGLALVLSAFPLGDLAGRHADEYRNYARGLEGEERLVALLREQLDGRWTLFRNVVPPDDKGDVDGVLVGPRGVFALEVKAYTSRTRNTREKWQYRRYGRWHRLSGHPGRQAKGNARRVGDHLRAQGIDVWVEPRVVWAGPGKLSFYKPAVRIWQLDAPGYIREDIAAGKGLAAEEMERIAGVLARV
jgi:hypothetical protein